jgi:phosphoserine phosphatase RsbU/P
MSAPAHGPRLDGELYEHAPCGLLSTQDNGMIERANQTFCSWLGFSSHDLVGKKRLQDLLTVGCKIFHQTHWMPLLQMQGSVAEVQLELVHRDGHSVPMIVNAVRHVTDGCTRQEIATLVATDRRKYERQLLDARKLAEALLESERKAQSELQQVLRERQEHASARALLAEQLIGIVSHDLRTPLHAVLLGSTLLAASGLNAAQTRTVARITSAMHRANRLITDLLDFTQARLGGGLRVTRAEVDLHAVVADCVEELKMASPGRAIEHRRLGEGTAFVDADRLSQLVTNLASNALTYGASHLPITVTSSVSAGELSVSVHNDGEPIPEQLVPHLFEPLRRGEQQLKSGSRSVGLGLYIVHEIATAHGGTVSVTSSKEAGTTFIFAAPAR